MIHAIVYAKQEGVQAFYESTSCFPMEYLPQIESVCRRVGVGYVPSQQEHALRYTPLQGCYMLNVMLRSPGGSPDEQRLHWNVVTYLLDAEAADRLFLLPYNDIRNNAVALSRKLLRDFRGETLPADLHRELLAGDVSFRTVPDARIPAHVLMTGALYSKKELNNCRLFIQVPGDPAPELDLLIHSLPPLLRRELSFHSAVYFPEDSFGVRICCCAEPVLERMEASGFNGCENGNIYYHYSPDVGRRNRVDERYNHRMQDLLELRTRVLRYDILQFAIPDWETYLQLADVARAKNVLRETFWLLEDSNLDKALDYARALELERLSQTELKRFLAVSGGKPGVKRSLRGQRTGEPGRLPAVLQVILEVVSVVAAVVLAVLLQADMLRAPTVWKSILSMALMLLAGIALRDLFTGGDRTEKE